MPCIGWRTKLMMEEKESIKQTNLIEITIPAEYFCDNCELRDTITQKAILEFISLENNSSKIL